MTDPVASARPRRLVPHPVWTLNVLVALAAAVLFVLLAAGRPALLEPHVEWWWLAIAIAAAERCVVHLHFRHHAHSFSLGDLPLVFGLLFCTPGEMLAATLAGSLLVFGFDRRLPPIKLVFNTAQFALTNTLAAIVVQALVAPGDVVTPGAAIAVLLGIEAGALIAVGLISVAISLSEARIELPRLREMFGMNLAVTVTNTSLGLVAAMVLIEQPWGLVLIVVPALTVFAVYRAYMTARERHDRLEFLYEANRTLARSPEAADAFEALLLGSLEAFRAECAELVLYSAETLPLRTTMTAGGERESMRPLDVQVADRLRDWVLAVDGVRVVDGATGIADVDRYLAERGVTHAMLAPLGTDGRVIGTLMIANRFGVVRGFGRDDRALFETLANNAGAALQNDRLEQAVGELRALRDELHHQAYHDPLTGLPNRSLFHERVRAALAAAEDDEVAVMFIDVDDFKTVNDSLGHGVGDELLRGVAHRLQECLRRDDLVARLGGDEFAVLLAERSGAQEMATVLSERLMDAFRLPIAAGDELVAVHLSVGIATAAGVDADVDELIRNADIAMYQAKVGGKGRFELFDPAAGAAIVRRHSLKEELARALAQGEIDVHYQPIVALASGRVVAAEALVRWNHPVRGLVGPSEFIGLAEETGLILRIGQLVLDDACRQARIWRDQRGGTEGVAVHVNLSSVEIAEHDLVARVCDALAKHAVDPRELVLEITESRLLTDPRSVEALRALRATGVRVALDDFGTGYSSLSYLQELPLDMLKIPKPFIDRLTADDDVFVRTICELASALDLEVVAEGIETHEQLRALSRRETTLGQGFLLARPDRARRILPRTVLPAGAWRADG